MAINNNLTDRYTLSEEMSRFVMNIVNPPPSLSTNSLPNPTQDLPNIPPLVQTVPLYDQGVNTASITITRPGPGPTIMRPGNSTITGPANHRASGDTMTATTGTTSGIGTFGTGAFFSEPLSTAFHRNEEFYRGIGRNVNHYVREYMTSDGERVNTSTEIKSDGYIGTGLGGLGGVDGVLAFLYKREEVLHRYYRESRISSQDARQYSRELSEVSNLIKTVQDIKGELVNKKGSKDLLSKVDPGLFISVYLVVYGEEGNGKREFVSMLPYYQPLLNTSSKTLEANPENTRKFNSVCEGLTHRHSSIVRFIGRQDFKVVDSSEIVTISSDNLLLPARRLIINEENYVKFFCNLKAFGGPISELKGQD